MGLPTIKIRNIVFEPSLRLGGQLGYYGHTPEGDLLTDHPDSGAASHRFVINGMSVSTYGLDLEMISELSGKISKHFDLPFIDEKETLGEK